MAKQYRTSQNYRSPAQKHTIKTGRNSDHDYCFEMLVIKYRNSAYRVGAPRGRN